MDSNDRLIKAVSLKNESKNKWYSSDTGKAPSIRYAHQYKIKFEYGPMLLAAVASEDIDETTRLIKDGADVNYANAEGLTPLHQACIDENFEMVKLLVDHGANINACDNEGWTSLHAAAHREIPIEIIKYLVNRGANIVAVNADGQLPVDLCENDSIIKYFDDEIEKRGIDIDEAREVEEKIMRIDAEKWQKSGKLEDIRDSQGATPLHVAASKGYTEIAHILLKCGADPNALDNEDWSPLHAAVYWKNKEIITDLVSHGAKIYLNNKNNQSPLNLAEKDIKPLLLSLANQYNQKQDVETAKKPSAKKNVKINGILKTAKTDENSKIPRPVVKSTTEVEKPETPKASSAPKSIPRPTIPTPTKAPTKTSEATQTSSSSIALPPTKPSIPTPSSIAQPPTKPSISTPTIAQPPARPTNIPTPTKPSAINLPIKPPSSAPSPSTSTSGVVLPPSRPKTEATAIPKPIKPQQDSSSSSTESFELKELKEKVISLENEINSLKKERENLLKIIDNLKSENQKSKPKTTTGVLNTAISRPPGKK